MFSVSYGSDGVGRAVVDFSAVRAGSLGELISVTERLNAAEKSEFDFVLEAAIGDLLSKNKFSVAGKKSRVANKWDLLAAVLLEKGYSESDVVECGSKGAIRAVRVLNDAFGLKSVKGQYLEF